MKPKVTQRISTCLWFNTEAEEAANFYCSIFKNSRIHSISRYNEAGAKVSGQPAGSVMTVRFELDGKTFVGLNGGPIFKFTEAISLIINCDTQEELDYYWEQLTANGGSPGPCGWLKDKFGLSWQIVPAEVDAMMSDKDPTKSGRVMEALLKMSRLDLAELRAAYAGS